jgi:hypothetical protein
MAAGAAAAAVIVVVSGTALASPNINLPQCGSFAAASAVYSSGPVVVYRAAVHGTPGTHEWACGPGGGYAAPLGRSDGLDGRYPHEESFDGFVTAGAWLAVAESSRPGWRSCALPGRDCRRYHHQVELDHLAGAGSSGSTHAGADVGALHVSSTRGANGSRIGAVVWTQSDGGAQTALESLTARESANASGPTASATSGTDASGAIVPSSVRLAGLRVSFVEAGHRRSVRLTP